MPQSYTPVTEDTTADYSDPPPRGGCFRRLCWGWNDGGGDYLLPHEKEPWVVIQLNKLKQLSEVVAGPKWKNMLRRIGKLCKCKKQSKETYSPESYALNFDEDRQEDDNLLHSFSTRFAVAPNGLISDQRKGGL